jgi:DNA invertase Pin-like site-specific DNA recombinase
LHAGKTLVRRLLRRVGKGGKVAQEPPVTVFEDARGPNVRVLRQAQRRLAPAESEALIADYEAGARVGERAKAYRLHRTTVAGHVARAGKTRPVMTEAQIDEAVLLYRDGWTLHDVGRRLGVADQTIRRVLVERAVTTRSGGRRNVATVA